MGRKRVRVRVQPLPWNLLTRPNSLSVQRPIVLTAKDACFADYIPFEFVFSLSLKIPMQEDDKQVFINLNLTFLSYHFYLSILTIAF